MSAGIYAIIYKVMIEARVEATNSTITIWTVLPQEDRIVSFTENAPLSQLQEKYEFSQEGLVTDFTKMIKRDCFLKLNGDEYSFDFF